MKRLTQLEQELEKTRQQLDETTKNSEDREKAANEVSFLFSLMISTEFSPMWFSESRNPELSAFFWPFSVTKVNLNGV